MDEPAEFAAPKEAGRPRMHIRRTGCQTDRENAADAGHTSGRRCHGDVLDHAEVVSNVTSASGIRPNAPPPAQWQAQELRLGKGLLSQQPPFFANNHHVAAIVKDLRRDGAAREQALALLSGLTGETRSSLLTRDLDADARGGAALLQMFGRSLVEILLETRTLPPSRHDLPSQDARRAHRSKALQLLVKWLRLCPSGSKAADGIMDGICAALAWMVLADSFARQKEETDVPPLLNNIPQKCWLRERDLRILRGEIRRANRRGDIDDVADSRRSHDRWRRLPVDLSPARGTGGRSGKERDHGKDKKVRVAAFGGWDGGGEEEGGGEWREAAEAAAVARAVAGDEESEWEAVVDKEIESGGGVRGRSEPGSWRRLVEGSAGRLDVSEAIAVVHLARESCRQVSECVAPARVEQGGGRAQLGGDVCVQVHDGIGLVSWKPNMCWQAGVEGGGRGARALCREADHVRRLEALALCLERLCGHPETPVAMAAVACVRAFARIPLLLASEQCPRLARACLPVLLPHFELRRGRAQRSVVQALAGLLQCHARAQKSPENWRKSPEKSEKEPFHQRALSRKSPAHAERALPQKRPAEKRPAHERKG